MKEQLVLRWNIFVFLENIFLIEMNKNTMTEKDDLEINKI
jgi:hypothetical protein